MPNHITNYVRIAGDKTKLAELKKQTIKKNTAKNIKTDRLTIGLMRGDEILFDFNGIIRMPKELLETVSPVTILDTQKEVDKVNADYDPSIISNGQSIKAITKAEQERRLKKYGAIDWYGWSVANWGTKWGAYNVTILRSEDEELCLQFDTAWSTAEPIFDKLQDEGFSVDCFWIDEDPSNEGTYGDPYEYFDINHYVEVEVL